MTKSLKISLLGKLRVSVDGVEIPLPTSRKTRALLGYLVATARPHRRERLCDLFWFLPDDPKAALRWSLSKLRRVLDDPTDVRVQVDGERVFIDTTAIEVDVATLHARAWSSTETFSKVELEQMADVLDTTFLEGLDKAGDSVFANWLATERSEIDALRTRVLDHLAVHADTSSFDQKAGANALPSAGQTDPDTKAKKSPNFASTTLPPKLLPQKNLFSPSQSWPQSRARAMRAQRIGFCKVADGTKIAHATVGSGPPLLKAANWLSHLEYDWASPIWGKSFATIARHRTFIRYDERGCGLSDWDVDDLSFEAFVEDLDAVVNNLGLSRFPLLGISQGCAVSIAYAVRYPERVSALILFGGYAAGWRHLASIEEQARREAVIKLTEVGWGTDTPAYRHIFSQTFMPTALPKDLDWFDEFQRLTTSPHNAARFQEAFGQIDVRDQLAKVQVPTLVLHSQQDQRIPLDQGRAIASAIPGAQFVPLDSRNHILVDHEPAWRVAHNAITRFLLENGV